MKASRTKIQIIAEFGVKKAPRTFISNSQEIKLTEAGVYQSQFFGASREVELYQGTIRVHSYQDDLGVWCQEVRRKDVELCMKMLQSQIYKKHGRNNIFNLGMEVICEFFEVDGVGEMVKV